MRLRHVIACVAALALLSAPGVAMAQGGGSAGDQQYTDPLAGSTAPSQTQTQPASSAPASTTPAPSSSSTPAPSTSSTPAPSTSTPAASSPPAATSSDPAEPTATTASGASSSAKTLPFTGINLWAVAGIGLTLTASGLLIRIRARA